VLPDTIGHVLFVIFPLAMAFAAASDLLTMTIANWLSLALAGLFLILVPVVGLDAGTVGLHFAAAGIVLAAAFTCFAFGWIGGGDAKFATAVVLWLGWDQLLNFLLTASIFGGGLTLLILTFRSTMLPAFALRQPWIERLHDRSSGVPYGLALAAAALTIYPDTVWMKLATG
jgi:prepilin peptidase CpaA